MHKPSHIRHEKNCLNCGAVVPSTFCPECGQANREPNLGIGDLLHDFVHMMTHFDGKFFGTVRLLLTKPGYLSKAFLQGQRVRFLPPVQMYVLTSAIFFFFFHSIFTKPPEVETQKETGKFQGPPTPLEIDLFMNKKDTVTINQFKDLKSFEAYHDALPDSLKFGMVKKLMIKKAILINRDYQKDPDKTMESLVGKLSSNFPKLLIVSLPFMALIFFLVFWRKKNLTFTSHLVFVIHFYVFVFVALLLSKGFSALEEWSGLSIFSAFELGIILFIFYYGLMAIRSFYGLGWLKGLLHYALILFLSLIAIATIFVSYIFLGLIFY